MTFVKKILAIACAVLCIASSAFASPADDKLFAAIEAGDADGVRAALDAGADINATDGVGGSAFLYAAMLPGASDLLIYLRDRGADISGAIDAMGGALECAAGYNSDMDVIRTLADMGLDRAEGGANSARLFDACYIAAYRTNPNPEVLRYFIDRGANIHAQDFDGDFADGGWIEGNIERLAWLRENGFYVSNAVTFLVGPEPGQEPSDAWAALGEPEKIFPSARRDGAGYKIRFVSDQTAVVELQAGGWKDGTFHKKDTVFAGTVSAGRVYEFTAPIMPTAEDGAYFLVFTSNDADQGTVEWYLQDEGYGGRQYRSVWRLHYAAG